MSVSSVFAHHRGVLALASCTLLVAAVVSSAQAAAPRSGSISDTSAPVQWTAGPFAAANVSGAAGDVACGPQLCDDFALHVSTPAGYGSTHQLTVKVAWAQAAADFDIYPLDSTSAVVASAASSSDPEVIVVPPTTGDYTVRVVPFAPLGQLVTGTATLTTVPTNPPPSTATPPTYSQYGAPGWKLSGGEVEAADAESSFSGNGVIGRWAIRAMTGCQGNTGVPMVTAKAG